jgi:CheY-like chemotaxis protein
MKIFLSSTYLDLIAHREAAARAVERLGQQNIRMEVFGARPIEPTTVCLDEMLESDALVGIYAHRYGFVPGGQSKSITEQEFDFAVTNQKPTFCFVVDDEYPWPPKYVDTEPGRTCIRAFLTRLRQQVVTDSFTTPEDLAFKVSASLGRFLLYRKIKGGLEKIPVHDSASTELGRTQVARRAARSESLFRGARLLLVNDVPTQMSHLIGILRNLGTDVGIETSSERALRALSCDTYHVVISDMERDGMPDEGIRFLRRMRQSGHLVPVIFTIGHFDPALGTPAFAFGVTDRADECLNLILDALERVRG